MFPGLSAADIANDFMPNGSQQQQPQDNQQQQQQPQPTFDIKEYGFNDAEHFKGEIERLRALEEEEKSDTPYIRDLRKAARSGIKVEDFNKARSIDLDKMTAAEKVSFARRLKNPNLSEEDANFLVSKEFGVEDQYQDVAEDQLPDEVREARIRLRLEEADAVNHLQQYKVDALTPPLEKNLKTWGDKLGSTISDSSTIEFTIDPKAMWGEDGEPLKLQYKPDSPELAQQLRETVESVLSVPDIEIGPDEEGTELIKSAVQRELFREKQKEIISHFVSEAFKIKTAMDLKKQINPTALGMPGSAPKGGEATDPDMILLNSLSPKK